MPRKNLYIILAEDDPDDQLTFTDAFHQLHPNIEVSCVNDGAELLEYLHSCTELPFLIIMDYKMPLIMAPDVLDRLALVPRFADIPKIVWSTSGRSEFVQACLTRGANYYFNKPNDISDLNELMKKISALISL